MEFIRKQAGTLVKQGLVLFLLAILALVVSPQSALAGSYGEGSYGEGVYNVGETSSLEDTSTPGPSEPSPPACGDQAPTTAPWLYGAIPQNGNSILIYFTEANDPVDHYALEFGTETGSYQFAAEHIGGKGARTYLVESLQPNTTYYFRVRAGNGCATGEWSNEISAKTKGLVSFNQLEIVDSELEPVEQTPQETVQRPRPTEAEEEVETEAELKPDGYSVNVKVVDTEQNPVVGAYVAIHSEIKEGTTDENGIARFEDVEAGQHRVLVAYDGYEGEQSIHLSGDTKEFNLHITVEPKNAFTSPKVLVVFGGLVLFIAVLAIALVRSRG